MLAARPARRAPVRRAGGPRAALDAAERPGRRDPRADPRRAARSAARPARLARLIRGGEQRVLERTNLTRAAHLVQRPCLAAPAVRVRAADARRGQAGQERARLHGQRRRAVDLCRRGALVAARARRAAGRAAGGAGAGVGPQRGADGHLRQPDRHAERAAVRRRGRSRAAAAAHPRGDEGGQGAPPGAAGPAAPGRHPVHPAGGVQPRVADHFSLAATGRPIWNLVVSNVPGPAVPAVHGRRRAGGQLSRCR